MAVVQVVSWRRFPIFLWITTLLLAVFLLPPVLPEVIYRVDPLALLSATLRTYQRAGCDTEQLSLSCPRGTSISIELAQYGRAGDITDNSLCPQASDDDTTTILDGVIHSGTEIEVKPPESCLWPNALQYSLLQTVVEACQKKRHCKFTATPKSIAGDPCPGIRKFVEIAYKCRPYEFRSKVACENDVIQLVCNPYSRIAIYGSSFGRTEYESVQCSQPQGVKEETCLASYATESVMQMCHGRRRCSLSADAGTFGKPCRPDSRMYLKVVYTCIPRKVLKDRYDTSPEPDEPQQSEFDIDQDELYDEDQFYKESEAIPPAPKLQGGFSNPSQHSFDLPFGGESSSSITPPILSRNDSTLEVPDTTTTEIVVTETEQNFLIPKLDNGDIFGYEPHSENYKIDENNVPEQKFYVVKKRKKFTPNVNSNSTRSLLNETDVPDCSDDEERVEVIGFIVEWMQAYLFLSQNQERFYLYLIISVAAGVFLCLILVIGRLVIQKRRAKTDTKFQQSTTGETQLPNGFSDDISEIDADIDLTTPLPVPSVARSENYMTYAPSPSPYGSSLAQSNVSHTSTTMLVPTSGLIVSGGGSRQPTPPPTMIGPTNAFMGPPVSGAMGALMPISSVSHHTTAPSYLTGSLMMGHHGTLRRTIIPAGGMIPSPSPTPPPSTSMGVVTTSICYDGTLPRSLSRGIPDNSQYYYG